MHEAEVDASTGAVHVDGLQWGDGSEGACRPRASGGAESAPPESESGSEVPTRAPRRFVGRRRAQEQRAGEDAGGDGALVAAGSARVRSRVVNAVPDDILKNAALNEMIAKQLPTNYSFEVHKTIWRLREAKATTVALQLPEGLQMFACALADIIGEYAQVEVVVLGDVTYGACCVDDLTARALGADMLIHYGHSCLVPIDTCCIKTMYVFVEISVDLDHLLEALKHNFDSSKRLLLVGTVQFVGSIHKIRPALEQHFTSVSIPQSRPLSKGEVLGCTAPTIDASGVDLVIYIGDGRFHLEAIMIANPSLPYYRYDPYSKVISAEGYAHDQLHHNRKKAIDVCSSALTSATVFGVIQGTLGRQGNPHVVERVTSLIKAAGKDFVLVLLSEITPQKLATFEGIDVWVQIACPRLSIDWGHFFDRPLLTPYELEVALKAAEWKEVYPMDYYAQAAGPWANYPRNAAAKAAS